MSDSNYHTKTDSQSLETEQDAYDFYNSYVSVVGFSIRRSKGHKGDKDGSCKWLDRVFCCSCKRIQGNDKRDDNVKCHRPETRCGCLAEMKISCRYKLIHVLASHRKRIFLRSQRSINPAQAVEAELADSFGIAPRASIGLMARRDYNNNLCTKRTYEMKSRDTRGLLEYLQRMQSEDLNFSYAILVDLDDLITNIFWADEKKEGRPFALFVGVNHHKQIIIFGAALLYDKTSETFMWLFDSFQKTMFGKKSQTMKVQNVAKQCLAMYQNATKQLKEVFGRYSTLAADFSSCVYDIDYEDDFLDAWDNMLDKYDLKNNSWLQRQFELREKWALVYGRKTFCADIQIKRYITYNHDLLCFFLHFQRADFKATQCKPSLEYPVEILKHAVSVYTPAVFKLFNCELWLTWDCELHKDGEVGFVVKYISPRKSRQHIV
ncbi:hypothetical protein RGQ29_015290 [Quercus rubra]|uniref:Protein FAR1-RELATED SEQUENCE n=1 Tax=Quercus rubra TaxID=3512 RepID=A0AAN7FVF0_QUERU|nr:hypothetical protein RGQ29_015290 [Quercus rubra]